MSDHADMHFQVQGSAALPYRLKAYGAAANFQLFCDCPAGRQARKMCKHAASLLMGEVTSLVQPSDDVAELARRAAGSALIASAFGHAPKPPPATVALDAGSSAGLDKALATIVVEAESMGWIVSTSADRIELYRPLKTGRPARYWEVVIERHPAEARPFAVISRKSGSKTFGYLDRAGALFRELAIRHQPSTP